MTLMIIGLILFFGVHLIPSTAIRQNLALRFGEDPYKGLFSVTALLGFALIVYGFSQTQYMAWLHPQPWGRTAAFAIMPIALIFIVAANTPNNLKRLVRHPMLIGIALWSASHLAANGDLASSVLFLVFGGFALLDIYLVEHGGRYRAAMPVSIGWDLMTIAIGLALTGIVYYFHYYVSGVPLVVP